MRTIATFAMILVISNNSESQVTKGNWLVGGTGSFLSSKNSFSSATYNSTSNRIDIAVSPNVGYFIVDNFAVGLKPSFSKFKDQVNGPGGGNSNINRFEIGPFVRYYFLDNENQYNILVSTSYQYGIYRFKPTHGNINTFSASVGPVIYFNTSVGLEFLLGYYRRRENVTGSYETDQKGLQMEVGFQVHLEK